MQPVLSFSRDAAETRLQSTPKIPADEKGELSFEKYKAIFLHMTQARLRYRYIRITDSGKVSQPRAASPTESRFRGEEPPLTTTYLTK
jgi:hypothetical protein